MTSNGIHGEGIDWLESEGPFADIVLSTRIRLARNLRDHRFGIRADAADRQSILDSVREAASGTVSLSSASPLVMSKLSATARKLLLERHMVSRELIGDEEKGPPAHSALLLAPGETIGMMVNEEDHVRLQCLVGGFRLREAWRKLDRLDEELSAALPFAYHPEFGFLTSCPTNVGTGLRASVLVHLPGLVLTQEITRVLQGITQVGLTFRGLYGEGSEVVGNFFQISNQTTLGKTEEDLIDHLQKIAEQVVQYERNARSVLMRDASSVIEDKVWRAYGLLRYAHSISFEEVMNLLSGVRLGVGLKLIPGASVYVLNEIMIFTQSAHLEQMAGRPLEKTEEDIYRASYIRRMLAGSAAPSSGDAAGENRA